jgi:hypothetical protein
MRAVMVQVGAKVLFDASQAIPHMPIDVQATGADLLVGTAHKLCGPTGIGFLWGRFDTPWTHLLDNTIVWDHYRAIQITREGCSFAVAFPHPVFSPRSCCYVTKIAFQFVELAKWTNCHFLGSPVSTFQAPTIRDLQGRGFGVYATFHGGRGDDRKRRPVGVHLRTTALQIRARHARNCGGHRFWERHRLPVSHRYGEGAQI